MIVGICGSRKIKLSVAEIQEIVVESGFSVDAIIDCKEPNGIDASGRAWANALGIPCIKEFPPEWDNFDLPRVITKINTFGKLYNSYAGIYRNHCAADYLKENDGGLILIWRADSKGSKDMLTYSKSIGIRVFEKILGGEYI